MRLWWKGRWRRAAKHRSPLLSALGSGFVVVALVYISFKVTLKTQYTSFKATLVPRVSGLCCCSGEVWAGSVSCSRLGREEEPLSVLASLPSLCRQPLPLNLLSSCSIHPAKNNETQNWKEKTKK